MIKEERLSIDKHFRLIDDFCCGADSPLDIFLANDSFEYDTRRYGNTYIVLSDDDQSTIWGFYTLKANGIQIEEKGEFVAVPVVEISRIAISFDVQDSGIGKYVFYNNILPKVINVSEIVAVNAIVAFVDPGDDKAIGFYKSIGFERANQIVQKEIEDSFNENCDLYLVSLNDLNN